MDKIVRYLSKIAKHHEISFRWLFNKAERRYYVHFYNPCIKKGLIRYIPATEVQFVSDGSLDVRDACRPIVKELGKTLID